MTQVPVTLTTWDEVTTHLLPALEPLRTHGSVSSEFASSFVFPEAVIDARLVECAVKKVDGCFPESTSTMESHSRRVRRTLRLLFEHNRSFIFVSIRRGRIRLFVQVANESFRNDWCDTIELRAPSACSNGERHPRSVSEFEAQKFRVSGVDERKHVFPDMSTWWSNGHVVCNVAPKHVWGDAFAVHILTMLESTLEAHPVDIDVDVVVNRRDFPLLSSDGVNREPNAHALGMMQDAPAATGEAHPLPHPKRRRRGLEPLVEPGDVLPVLGFYSSSRFADVPIPVAEDWELATGVGFAPHGRESLRAVDGAGCDTWSWKQKAPKAVFRGSHTGDEQRVDLCHCSLARPDLLDARITKRSKRDRFDGTGGIVYPSPGSVPSRVIGKAIPQRDQFRQFKYVVYAAGHSASSRYGALMCSGCTILRVAARGGGASGAKADAMWLDPALRPAPWTPGGRARAKDVKDCDHVPVSADLSDVFDAITWCQRNDAAARAIAKCAAAKAHKLLHKSTIHTYMGHILHRCATAQSLRASTVAESGPFGSANPAMYHFPRPNATS